MLRALTFILGLAALTLLPLHSAAGRAAPEPRAPEGFTALFNGRDLTGWDGGAKYWSVEDGSLTGTADGKLDHNRFIVWRGGTVKNFELRIKVRLSPGGNSGLQYRSVERPDLGEAVVTGYQCDVVSNRPDYDGMLYEERGRRILAHTSERVVIDASGQPWVTGEFPLREFKTGEWHDYRVLARANHLEHWIDGHPTVDVVDLDKKGRRLEGVLGFQVHVGPPMKIQFRDIFLKRLPDDLPLLTAAQAPIPAGAPKGAPQGQDPPKPPNPAFSSAGLPPLDLGGIREEHVMIPMRDGARLSAYLYFPQGKGPWPVLFQQRYASLAGSRQAHARMAAAGYVVCAANFRGTYLSEGTWQGYRALGWGRLRDGYDTCEWLAVQPWSTGKVGTWGGSQAGYAQNFLAVTQPPHLVAQYMTDTGLSLFQEGYRIGGTTRPERFKQMDDVCRVPSQNRDLLAEWFAHPTYDDYWKAEDCSRQFSKMNVPCFTLGGWFDFMNQGSVESYIGREHRGGPGSRGAQQLLIGPWLHGGSRNEVVNELRFPVNVRWDQDAHMLRWFDHTLKGIDNGVERDPKVKYYVMGATGEPGAPGNEWRTAPDWPIPARVTPYFLRDGGGLSRQKPVETSGATAFRADPEHPAEIPGRAFPGAKDAREFEKQPEVRTFTSEVLAEPVEWTGRVTTELYVTSTAKDTDFIVRVSDVYPDGRSMLLIDYVRRARYREGFDRAVMMEPGKVYRVAFQVGWLSQVFNRGHRIRVTVASTGAPFYEPNPNTGEPLTLEWPARTMVAENTVQHNRRYASKVLAPVVPRPADRG